MLVERNLFALQLDLNSWTLFLEVGVLCVLMSQIRSLMDIQGG
jgi:hypothetical protein